MDYTERCLSSEAVYRGRIIYVHRDEVSLTDGSTGVREIVEHSGGVAVLPLEEDGRVWCVRQYRYAMGCHLLELPAGKLNDGEDPLECAVRELGEETGFTAEQYTYLGAVYPSPGYCRETLHLYLAAGLKPGQAHPDEGEFLDLECHTLEELTAMVMDGSIADAKTAMAVLKTKLLLDGKEKPWQKPY